VADPIVGIDLGTSNSVVAHADAMGNVRVLADDQNYKIHPSVVSFHPNGGVVVGSPAKQRKVIDPQNTIYSVKRLIGRAYSSPEVKIAKKRMPYQIKEGENELPLIVTRGGEFAPPEISAIVLDHVRNIATMQLNEEVQRAVVTVPASFNDAQRSATATAGAIAGITVVRVLNEPTAAALAYGNTRSLKQTIAVYDFGGGTFDITILRLNDQVYEVLGTAGDTFLGGDDLDERLVDRMVQKFLAENRIDLRTNEVSMMRLRAVAEQTKIELSRRSRAVVRVDEIAYGPKGKPLNLQIEITRDEFVSQVADIIDKTFPVCKEALSYASLGIDKIDDIILVGGTTKIPYVRDQVSKFFAKAPRTDVNPEDAVAVGAALQATSLERILSRSGRISAVQMVPQEEDLGLEEEATSDTAWQDLSAATQIAPEPLEAGAPIVPPKAKAKRITAGYQTIDPKAVKAQEAPRAVDTGYSLPRSGTRDIVEDKPANAIGRLRPTAPSQPLPKQTPVAIPAAPTTSRGMTSTKPPPIPGAIELEERSSPIAEWGSEDDFATKPGDQALLDLGSHESETAIQLESPRVPQRTTAPAAVAPPPPGFGPPGAPKATPTSKTIAMAPVAAPPPRPRAPSAPPVPMPRAKAPSTQPGFGAMLDLETEPSAASTAKGFQPPAPTRTQAAVAPPQTYPVMPAPAPPRAAPVVMDVTPRSLGIATVAGFCEELIRRNSRLPTRMVKMFSTSRDQQQAVRIVVCQGESRRLDNNTVIGDLNLVGLQPRARGETSIEVTFSLDASGILQVRAKDAQTGREEIAQLDLVGGVREQDVAASRDRIQQLRRE
jgi:molecular chaperone DnaK